MKLLQAVTLSVPYVSVWSRVRARARTLHHCSDGAGVAVGGHTACQPRVHEPVHDPG